MKSIKVIGYGLWVMVALLLSAPITAQEWQSTSAFQSTSTMTGSGSSYSSNPSLNANGTASAPAYGPRRAKMDDGPSITIDVPPIVVVDPEKDKITPVGDAVLPMLLFAAGFAGVIALRRKRAVKE